MSNPKIGPNEWIVGAWADKYEGPGWANGVIWVLIQRKGGGEFRLEAMSR